MLFCAMTFSLLLFLTAKAKSGNIIQEISGPDDDLSCCDTGHRFGAALQTISAVPEIEYGSGRLIF